MYDFTMPFPDGNNFAFGGTPLMKNSDGDVLGIFALGTKEGLENAEQFSPETRNYFKDSIW
jgi:hypothetical protein